MKLHRALPKKASWSPTTHLLSSPPEFHLTPETITHLARLSGLHLSPEEASSFKRDIEGLCGMVDPIRHVDTEGVEPLVSLVGHLNATRLGGSPVADSLAPSANANTASGTTPAISEERDPSGHALLPWARKLHDSMYAIRKPKS